LVFEKVQQLLIKEAGVGADALDRPGRRYGLERLGEKLHRTAIVGRIARSQPAVQHQDRLADKRQQWPVAAPVASRRIVAAHRTLLRAEALQDRRVQIEQAAASGLLLKQPAPQWGKKRGD